MSLVPQVHLRIYVLQILNSLHNDQKKKDIHQLIYKIMCVAKQF